MIHQFLNALEFGEAQKVGSLTCWPIINKEASGSAYVTFEQALTKGLAEISEVSESGVVGELLFINKGAGPVFLLDGEQVVGLKQNRTFNLSMIAPSTSRTVIPVSCLEHGRWARSGHQARAAEHVHFASGRAGKVRSVSENLDHHNSYASAQGEVWEAISERMAMASVRSTTAAEADYFQDVRGSIETMVDALKFQDGQVGWAFATGGRLLGFDAFGSPTLFRELAGKVARSYAAEALQTAASDRPSTADPKSLIADLMKEAPSRFPAPGAGETFRWRSDGAVAAALAADGQCVHIAAFPNVGH